MEWGSGWVECTDGAAGAGIAPRADPRAAARRPFLPRSPVVTQYLGYLAGFLTVVSFLPQVLRVWRTKEVKDLSFKMFVLLIIAGSLWITYGVITTDWPVIATNVGTVSFNAAILAAKVRYRNR